jgi:hypothetical protein
VTRVVSATSIAGSSCVKDQCRACVGGVVVHCIKSVVVLLGVVRQRRDSDIALLGGQGVSRLDVLLMITFHLVGVGSVVID